MIAYLLLVHRFPAQFKRLFQAIYDPENHYLIHVDKNADPAVELEISAYIAAFPNCRMLLSKKSLWGGYSLVDAELRGMRELLAMNADWEYFINLSGQDFPLRTQADIKRYLLAHRGKEFIKVLDQETMRPDTMPRIQRFVVELRNRIYNTAFRRPFLKNVRPYIGNQWMIVSRSFCQFVCHAPEVHRYKAFYRHTFIADEGFFQTVMMNAAPHGEIVSDDLRYIDWVPEGDIKLRPRTFTAADAPGLTTSHHLFARKFDMEVDSEIFDILEQHLGKKRLPSLASALSFNAV